MLATLRKVVAMLNERGFTFVAIQTDTPQSLTLGPPLLIWLAHQLCLLRLLQLELLVTNHFSLDRFCEEFNE